MSMPQPPENTVALPMLVVVALILSGGLAVWLGAFWRLERGLPLVPFRWRRPVPWRAFHVGLVALAYVLLPWVTISLDFQIFGPRARQPVALSAKEGLEHPLAILLDQSRTPGTLLLVILAAVVVAPIVEEFTFRLVLQGWLERVEQGARRRVRFLRAVPGFLPVTLVAVLFASMHYRSGMIEADPRALAHVLGANAVGSVLVLLFGLSLLRTDAGADRTDLGFPPGGLAGDLRLGVAAFLGMAPLVYVTKAALSQVLPSNLADPIALLVFALVLGVLYHRTHRLMPAILLHTGLNATSLLMAWYQFGA